jgi:hypothetical protein
MSKAMKGAVLSGLVLPGLGQIVLKHYLRGTLILLAALACLVFLMVQALEQANAIIANLDLVNAAIEPQALLAEVSRAARTSSGQAIRGVSWLFMLLWLGGTVDAWWLGRKLDRQERDTHPSSEGL